jgi:hypothetical protein
MTTEGATLDVPMTDGPGIAAKVVIVAGLTTRSDLRTGLPIAATVATVVGATLAVLEIVGGGTLAVVAIVAGETVTLPPTCTDGVGSADMVATVAGVGRAVP